MAQDMKQIIVIIYPNLSIIILYLSIIHTYIRYLAICITLTGEDDCSLAIFILVRGKLACDILLGSQQSDIFDNRRFSTVRISFDAISYPSFRDS